MASRTVTLEKSYFETLLRRAQFHTSGVDFTTPLHLPTVTIPKNDHDSLLDLARQYANLRRNLFKGGIPEGTFGILIQDDPLATENGEATVYSAVEDATEGSVYLKSPSLPSTQNASAVQGHTYGRNANYTPHNGDRPRDAKEAISNVNNDSTFMRDAPSDSFHDGEGCGDKESQTKISRPRFDKFAKRTILLANLPEGVTHADIVNSIRGGMLLDIFLRTNDRAASVSFLNEAHAQEFYLHVKRYDLYICGKRVEIRWNDRQFILPPHVANKISIGATRNLVIRNCNPKLTEKAIRDDLEHIHNLVVVRLAFNGQNAYVSTNSVHNAMFARTCMMSRATYKGSKIDWDNDECAAPLKKPVIPSREAVQPRKKSETLMNRFQLLNMDGTEDGSEDEDLDNSGVTF